MLFKRSLGIALVVFASSVPVLHAQPRKIRAGTWTELARIDAAHGTVIGSPSFIDLSGDDIVVYDSVNALRSFTRAGQLKWTSGNASEGDARLRSVGQIIGDGAGGAMILDHVGSRITRVSPAGTVQERTLLTRPVLRIARTSNGKMLVASAEDGKFELLSTHMRTRERKDIEKVVPLHSDRSRAYFYLAGATIVVLSDGSFAALSSTSTEARLLSTSLKLRRPFSLLDADDPRSSVLGQQVLRSISGARDTLYVVDDRTIVSRAMVDLYDPRKGHYVESRELPTTLRIVRVDGDVLVGFIEGEKPGVAVWRWKAGEQ